jgi:mersacidin/lichenicidin family type 2 lantibiotic
MVPARRVTARSYQMKKNIDVARAWRDQDYYLSLTEDERVSLGTHPAGIMGVEDGVLSSITGGCGSLSLGGTVFCTPCGRLECGA